MVRGAADLGAVINITLRARDAIRGIRRTDDALEDMGDEADRSRRRVARLQERLSSIRNILAGATAAVVAFGLAAVTAFARTGDEAAKMAATLGLSTSAIQELGYVVQISGGNIGDLRNAIRTLAVATAEARDGQKEYIDEFERIGIAVEELEGLRPDQVFTKVVAALNRTTDAIDRTASGARLLGRGFVNFGAITNLTASDLAALRQEARDIGFILSEEDAAAAEEVTDQFLRMRLATQGLVTQLGAALAPVLIDIVNIIRPTISTMATFIQNNQTLARVVGVTVVGALAVLTVALTIVTAKFAVATVAATAFGVATLLALKPLLPILLAITGAIAAIQFFTGRGGGTTTTAAEVAEERTPRVEALSVNVENINVDEFDADAAQDLLGDAFSTAVARGSAGR